MRSSWRGSLLASTVALLVYGCAATPEGGPAETLGLAAGALSGDGGDAGDGGSTPASCSLSDITAVAPARAAQTCNGPWVYQRWNTCTGRMPECPQECKRYNPCVDYSFGLDPSLPPKVTAVPSPVFQIEPDWEPKECAPKTACAKPPYPATGEANARCKAMTAQLLASERALLPAQYQSKVTSQYSVTMAHDATTFTCNGRVSRPLPATGTGGVCNTGLEKDCAEHQPSSCTLAVPECKATGVSILSAPGIRYDQIKANDPSAVADGSPAAGRCSTCEDIAVVDGPSARAKADCLATSFTAQDPNGGYDLARSVVARNLRALSELRGEMLTPDQRRTARDAYAKLPDAELKCSASRIAPAVKVAADTCSDTSVQDLSGAINQCAHLLLSEVSMRNSAIQVDDCISALQKADDLAATDHDAACDGPLLRRAAFDAVSKIVSKGLDLGAIDGSADPLTFLPRILHTVDAWYKEGARRYAIDGLPLVSTGNRATQLDGGDAGHASDAGAKIDGGDAGHASDAGAKLDAGEAGDGGAASALGVERPLDMIAAEVLGGVWTKLLQRGRVLDDIAKSTDVAAALQQATERGLALDRNVLTAAFSKVGTLDPIVDADGTVIEPPITLDAPPISGVPLLYVTGDSLTALAQRLDAIRAFHDFACQFEGCTGATRTPVSELWTLLGALSSKGELDAALANTPDALDGWTAVFSTIDGAYQASLTPAITAQSSDPNWAGGPPASLTAPLRPLAEIVSAARDRSAAFKATGLFASEPANMLHAGIGDTQRSYVLGQLNTAIDKMTGSVATYQTNLGKTVSGLEDIVAAQTGIQKIHDDRMLKAAKYAELGRELAALRAQGLGDDDVLEQQYAAIKGAVDANQLIRSGDPASYAFTVSAASAKYAGGTPQSIGALSVPEQGKIRVKKGTRLGVSAPGVWSPTCALSHVSFTKDGAPLEAPPRDADISSEGFHVSVTADKVITNSHTTTDSSEAALTIGFRAEDCVVTPEQSSKACAYVDAHVTWAVNESTSGQRATSQRTSASFDEGMRLPNTPFPDLPAGALLAVIMPQGIDDPARYVDVQVVRPGGSLISIGDDADVWFVVNDLSCDSAFASKRLNVTATTMVPFGAMATATVNAIDTTMKHIRNDVLPGYVARASFLPSEAQAEQTWAQLAWQAELIKQGINDSYTTLPQPLQLLFSAAVQREMVRIDRRVADAQINLTMDELQRAMGALDDDERLAVAQSRLAELQPTWALRDLDGTLVRNETASLLDNARRYLYPMLDLWYPSALPQIRQSTASNEARSRLDNMLASHVDTSMIDLVQSATATLGLIVQQYTTAPLGSPQVDFHPPVALSFPRPAELGLPDACTGLVSEFPKADATRARAVWKAALNRTTATIQIVPEDVYRVAGPGGALGCIHATPVIHKMGVVVLTSHTGVTASDDLARFNQYRWLAGNASAVQPFMTELGRKDYMLAEEMAPGDAISMLPRVAPQPFELGIIYVDAETVLGDFKRLVLDDALRPSGPVGLSPFGEMKVDFGPLGSFTEDGLVDACEIALAMQVDTRQTTRVPVSTCKTPVSTTTVSTPTATAPPATTAQGSPAPRTDITPAPPPTTDVLPPDSF